MLILIFLLSALGALYGSCQTMIIKREISHSLKSIAKQFPIIAITGPVDSGKTTLIREVFPEYTYVTLENLHFRIAAKNDPRGFLVSFLDRKGVVIEEVDKVPELLSYMQGIVDEYNRPGFFILTSRKDILTKPYSSLMGRIAILTLLPFSVCELKSANLLSRDLDEHMFRGCYPQAYAEEIDFFSWRSHYLSMYVDQHLKNVLEISDSTTFYRFLQACATQVSSIINYAKLARDANIHPTTAKTWVLILESSCIIKLVQPYYKNFNKRVVKSPKLYFYDTGLVCALLGIKERDISTHPLRRKIFESFIMSEIFKYNFNHALRPELYFWNDVLGRGIDCIIERSYGNAVPIDMRMNVSMTENFFKDLLNWEKISGQEKVEHYIIYGGDDEWESKGVQIIPWHSIAQMMDKIYE